jgi:excisionase family DNA binding protein
MGGDVPTGPAAGDGALYTMRAAARLKGVSYHTVSRAVHAGRLPARRLGRQALIAAADLAAWAPMVQRAPRKYRRPPDPDAAPAPVDAATLDRADLERRVATHTTTLAARVPGLAEGELRALAARLAALLAAAPGDER